MNTMEVIERAEGFGKITVPYISGFLTFRELPLIVETAKKLRTVPDLFLFDGNGILHPRRIGIAAHGSFFLRRTSIGVAKTHVKFSDIKYQEPASEKGSFTDIAAGEEAIGRALRTSAGVKPIFVSPGNWIDLHSATQIALSPIGSGSRLPVPIREADIATREMRRKWETAQRESL